MAFCGEGVDQAAHKCPIGFGRRGINAIVLKTEQLERGSVEHLLGVASEFFNQGFHLNAYPFS